MKLYPDKLAADLNAGVRQLYLVSGDEPLLVQESCDQIRQALKTKGYVERDLFHVEARFDWNSLLYSVGSMSLFAEKKIIEVRMPSGKPGDQGSKVLMELAAQLGDDSVLLLVLPRVGQDVQRTKWFKTLEAASAFVQIWPIEAKDLPRWLDGRFRQAGLKASREAVQVMAERIEGNLLAAVQEIERLRLIVPDGQIGLDHVQDGVADNARYDVFKLIDAAMAGDATRAARMALGLKSEGVEMIYLISMLVRELRSLEMMKSAIEAGENPRSVMKKARVWSNREGLVTRCLKRHSAASIRRMTASVGAIDRMVKGITPGEPWRELQTVMLSLAGAPPVQSA